MSWKETQKIDRKWKCKSIFRFFEKWKRWRLMFLTDCDSSFRRQTWIRFFFWVHQSSQKCWQFSQLYFFCCCCCWAEVRHRTQLSSERRPTPEFLLLREKMSPQWNLFISAWREAQTNLESFIIGIDFYGFLWLQENSEAPLHLLTLKNRFKQAQSLLEANYC